MTMPLFFRRTFLSEMRVSRPYEDPGPERGGFFEAVNVENGSSDRMTHDWTRR